MSIHEVFVVLDTSFSGDLCVLSRHGHVWIVDTERNKAAAQHAWSQVPAPSWPTQGVTTFAGVAGDPETLYSALPTIDEHHGEYSADPPWQIIHVRGVDIRDVSESRIRDQLSDGAVHISPEPDGFAIVRNDYRAASDGHSSGGR